MKLPTQSLFAAALLGSTAICVPALHATEPAYAQLRAERAKELTQPYGWFSLIALEWLKPDANTTVGSAPGESLRLAGTPAHLMSLTNRGGKVSVASAEPGITLGGKAVLPGEPLPTGESDADALAFGSTRFWVIDRGGQQYLRVKDSKAPALVHYHGLHWFAPDPHYVITARWVPYTTPHTMPVMNKLGQVTPEKVPGYAEFVLDGKTLRLTPMSADEYAGMFFVLRDKTAPRETDGGGRFLRSDAPSNGLTKPGTVVLDFNNAVNPPCAYSPYATCPLATPENRLPVAIDAGEKNYE